MAQVKVLVNGSPTTVNETTPGLFGRLGYTYVEGGPKTTKTKTKKKKGAEAITHPETGARGAVTPQGEKVYGPLAEQYLDEEPTPSPKIETSNITGSLPFDFADRPLRQVSFSQKEEMVGQAKKLGMNITSSTTPRQVEEYINQKAQEAKVKTSAPPIAHPKTGAPGARTPQGDIVYGPLAEEYLKKDPTKLGQQIASGDVIEKEAPPAMDIDNGGLYSEIGGKLKEAEEEALQIQKRLEEMAAERDKDKPPEKPEKTGAEKDSIWNKLLGKREEISEDKPTLETYQEILEGFGYTPEVMQKQQELQGQMIEYRRQMQELEAEKKQKLGLAEQQYMGRLTATLRGEQAMIERQYNSRIAAKGAEASLITAQYELSRGLQQDAIRMADTAMQYKMFEYDQKLADLKWMKDIYKEMSAEEDRIWQKEYAMWKDERDFRFREEQQEINNWFKEQSLSLQKMGVQMERERLGLKKREAGAGGNGIGDLGTHFSPQELREIRREGIDPGTPEGFQKAMDYIKTEEKPELTTTQKTKMAERGLPMDVSEDIHGYSLEGHSFDTIYNSMKESFDPLTAGKYIDAYREVIRSSGQMTITGEPVEIRDLYEKKAREEMEGEGEEEKEEGKGWGERFGAWINSWF